MVKIQAEHNVESVVVMTDVSNDGIGRTCGVDSDVTDLAKKGISSKKVTSAET
jgi:hypothetical protein